MVTRDKITAYNNSAGASIEAPAELCLRLIRFYDFLYLLSITFFRENKSTLELSQFFFPIYSIDFRFSGNT